MAKNKKSKPIFFRYTDPQRNFSLTVLAEWELVRPKEGEITTSFLLKKNHTFHISCVPVTEHHKKTIDANQLQPQKSSQGNLPFVERFDEGKAMSMYTWFCLVDNYILMATYIIHKAGKEPTETPSGRLSLHSLRFHGKE